MTWQTLVTLGHIIGTVLGVGGATFAEIFSRKAFKKNPPDPIALDYLRTTYTIMRVGLIILVVSGFGFLLLARFEGQAQHIYGPRVWAKMTITLVILLNALMMQGKKIPLGLGSSISLTSWYAALIIGAWRMKAGYMSLMLYYILAIILVTIVKELILKPKTDKI